MNQVKIPTWIGVVQVQLTNSFFYISLINTLMLSITMWANVGPSIQEVWAPASYWMMLVIGFIVVCTIMLLDYKFMYPVRQAFVNEQACKHENPAMEEILSISSRMAAIEEKLGIVREDEQ